MKPEQLRYDHDTATRYSDPPGLLTFEQFTLHLLDHYQDLLRLRDVAMAQHIELIHAGVFQSVPTLTTEKRNGRPGTYWRAVFKTNSPEVLSGLPRKHYIGNDEAQLFEWTDCISRTQLAMSLNQLIHDIGMTLKHASRTTSVTATTMSTARKHHTQALEQLQ